MVKNMKERIDDMVTELKTSGERRTDRWLFQWANKGYSMWVMIGCVVMYFVVYYAGVWRGCCW